MAAKYKIIYIIILCLIWSSLTHAQEKSACLRVPVGITAERAQWNAYRAQFEERRQALGGKDTWDEILEKLSRKIGFKTMPNTVRFTVQEAWAKFIEHNKALVDEGNKIIEESHGKITPEQANTLRRIIGMFKFPEELKAHIQERTKHIQGDSIGRSSWLWEDLYERNLAGIFISLREDNQKLIAANIAKIFYQGLFIMWIGQNTVEKPIDGIPNTVSSEQGCGLLEQSFVHFAASGTVMSNLYGHTSIETVVGDLEFAVNANSPYAKYPNIGRFIFKKDDYSEAFEYDAPFSKFPHVFRLRGTMYSPEINSEERLKILEIYEGTNGKIQGKFSPISEKQAREIRRVADALEAEIGVPLDLEWGFDEGGDLYIVQMRPLIGDFSKPLIEKGAELAKKQSIARTSIALGQTSQEGFTGKMVLFGNVVDHETVEALEREMNYPYIRLQDDVASHVDGELKTYGTHTKAKVIVDVLMGSLQAHNVNLITGRISSGEFSYASGPILRDGLENNITFIPHPTLRGVWVSLEDITYFGNGLKGEFYVSKDNKTPMPELKDTKKALLAFHEEMRELLADSSGSDFSGFVSAVSNVLLGIKPHDEDSHRVLDSILFSPKNIGIEIFLECLKEGTLTLHQIQKFEESYADLIEEALSYPLFPPSWEHESLEKLKKLLIFKGISSALETRTRLSLQPTVAQKPERPEKLKVLVVEDDPTTYEITKDCLMFYLDTKESEIFFAKTLIEANEIIKNEGIHAVIFDLNIGYAPEGDIAQFDSNLRNTPHIIVVSGTTKERIYKTMAKRLKDIVDRIIIIEKPFGFSDLAQNIRQFRQRQLEQYEKALAMWQALHPQKPEKPEKLRVLIIDDNLLSQMAEALKGILGEGEYEIQEAIESNEAMYMLEDSKVDAIIYDWGTVRSHQRLKAKILETSRLILFTGLGLGEVKSDRDGAKLAAQSICIATATLHEYIPDNVRAFRKQQLEQYEQALAQWQAGQKENQPPEKLRILYVEDDTVIIATHVDHLEEFLGVKKVGEMHYAGEWYEIFIATNAKSAIVDVLTKQDIDYVILDWMLGDVAAVNVMNAIEQKGIKNVDIHTAYGPYGREAKTCYPDLNVSEFPLFDAEQQIKRVRQMRQRQLDEWYAKHPEATQKTGDEDAIFIINSSFQEAKDLEELIKAKTGDMRKVVIIGSLWELERELKNYKPSLVITDSELDGAYNLQHITGLVGQKNPDAQFIVASEYAAILPDNVRTAPNILRVIEKPFYFRSVLEAM